MLTFDGNYKYYRIIKIWIATLLKTFSLILLLLNNNIINFTYNMYFKYNADTERKIVWELLKKYSQNSLCDSSKVNTRKMCKCN